MESKAPKKYLTLKVAALAASVFVFAISINLLFTASAEFSKTPVLGVDAVNVAGVATTQIAIKPSADTFVRQRYSGKNYEGLADIVSDGSPKVVSLLRFDLPQINLSDLTSAELLIIPNLNRRVDKLVKIVNSPWTASSVTWNTMPTLGATAGALKENVKAGQAHRIKLDVSLIKASWPVLNLALDDISGGQSLTFKSLETGTPGSQLVLTIASGGTTPIPDPDPEPPGNPSNPQPLVATIVSTPSTGVAPLVVNLDGRGSTTDPSATITNYSWTLGGGATSTNPSFLHTYTVPGDYTVKLRITDSLGRTAEATKVIKVSAPIINTEPVISDALPTGTLMYSVTTVTLSVRTDVNSTCRYNVGDSDFDFAHGTQFAVTVSRLHTQQVSGLQPGTSYSYYVKCQTTAGVTNSQSASIEFSLSPLPGDTVVTLQSPYGIFPNCIAPGVPIESQEWWQEDANPLSSDGDDLFMETRHVHVGVCAPNARAITDTQSFGGIQDFVAVVVMHNNPAALTWVAAGFQDNDAGQYFRRVVTENGTKTTNWQIGTSECEGGSTTCVVFKDPISCDGLHTCQFRIALRVDMSTCAIDGNCELRIRPNLTQVPPRNERAFTTLNFQINVGGTQRYRASAAPIGRGWYTNVDYANVSIDNYMALFNGNYNISIPRVSGTIKLNLRHREAIGGKSIATLRIDPSAHIGDRGILVYERPMTSGSLNMDNVAIDTTKLSNGIHALFASTNEQNDVGKNIGNLRLFINVQN